MSFQVEKYGKCSNILYFESRPLLVEVWGGEKLKILSPIYVVIAMNLEGREVPFQTNHMWTCGACHAQILPPNSQEEGVTFWSFVCSEGMPFWNSVNPELSSQSSAYQEEGKLSLGLYLCYKITFELSRDIDRSLLILGGCSLPCSIMRLSETIQKCCLFNFFRVPLFSTPFLSPSI